MPRSRQHLAGQNGLCTDRPVRRALPPRMKRRPHATKMVRTPRRPWPGTRLDRCCGNGFRSAGRAGRPGRPCHRAGSAKYSSFWVGLDGFSSSSVEQTGSEVDCSGRTAQYYSWYEMYPAYPVNFSNTVRPGDHFTGSVTFTGGSSYTLVLSDTTQGWSHTVNASLSGAANSSAEVIAEAPCCTASGGILPLAHFSPVTFSSATVDGSAIGNFNPTQIIMVNSSSTPKDSISALSGGTSFTATWLRSN